MDASPSPAELALVQRLARVAITEGKLALRPFRLQWFNERDELWPVAQGCTVRTTPPTMYLSVGLDRRDLAAVVFHELMHVADLLNPVDPPLTTDELERRAEKFATRMMTRWRG
jgi:hypothetical protein